MGQIIFNMFQLFADIPVNIWPWILLVTPPLLIFSAKPQHSARWRFWRIILAIAIGYVLINLTLHTHRALQRSAYEQCQQEMLARGENPHSFDPCGHHINIADGASNVFYLVLGWIPAAAYTGLNEWIWRRKHRHVIHDMGTAFRGKWFSTVLIVSCTPLFDQHLG